MNERIKRLADEIKDAIEKDGQWTGHTGWLPETENPADMEGIEVRYVKITETYKVTWGEERYERYIDTIEKAAEFVASLMDGGNGIVKTANGVETLDDFIEKNARPKRQYRRREKKPAEKPVEAVETAEEAVQEVTEERIKEVWKIIDETMLDMCSIVRVSRNNARINRERKAQEEANGVTWRRWRR